jgi:hypothetical protein
MSVDRKNKLRFQQCPIIGLVTPALTHWLDYQDHTGHIAILKIEFVPEPHAVLLLAAGAGVLVVLRRVRRRG